MKPAKLDQLTRGRARAGWLNARVRRAAVLVLLVAAAALPACGLFTDEEPAPPADSFEERSPVPGQPPLGWVSGRLQEIADDRITMLDPSQSDVVLQRLAEGATTFLAREDGGWRELTADEVASVQAGRAACAEVLLDGTNLVALRIFLDAGCGPSGDAP